MKQLKTFQCDARPNGRRPSRSSISASHVNVSILGSRRIQISYAVPLYYSRRTRHITTTLYGASFDSFLRLVCKPHVFFTVRLHGARRKLLCPERQQKSAPLGTATCPSISSEAFATLLLALSVENGLVGTLGVSVSSQGSFVPASTYPGRVVNNKKPWKSGTGIQSLSKAMDTWAAGVV